MTQKPWTTTDIRFLRENYGTVPVKELANYLGRSVGAIYRRANRERLSSTKSKLETMKKMIVNGHTKEEIAVAVNVTPERARRLAKTKLGLTTGRSIYHRLDAAFDEALIRANTVCDRDGQRRTIHIYRIGEDSYRLSIDRKLKTGTLIASVAPDRRQSNKS